MKMIENIWLNQSIGLKHIADYDLQLINGITNSGKLCKTKCKRDSKCSILNCGTKNSTCINVEGQKENVIYQKINAKVKNQEKKEHVKIRKEKLEKINNWS